MFRLVSVCVNIYVGWVFLYVVLVEVKGPVCLVELLCGEVVMVDV